MATERQIARLRARMVKTAKSKGRIAYSEIDHLVRLDVKSNPHHRKEIGVILAGIGRTERKARRPFLPAVVVRKHSRRPGPAFYREVRRRYQKYQHIVGNLKLHDAVLRDVHSYWSKRA